MINDVEIYFIHGTSIDNRVWSEAVISSISNLFSPNLKPKTTLFDWSGANNTEARNVAAEKLLSSLVQRKKEIPNWRPKSIIFVGHSHGGSVLLISSGRLRKLIGPGIEISFLTLNTPNVVGGAFLEDLGIHHYHVYCKSDMITPRAGFNKTGVLRKGGENKNWFGKPVGGEYSRKKDFNSNVIGAVNWEFETANVNIEYKDQYRFKGINPRSHFVSHRGWLVKNVNQWLPILRIRINEYTSTNTPPR